MTSLVTCSGVGPALSKWLKKATPEVRKEFLTLLLSNIQTCDDKPLDINDKLVTCEQIEQRIQKVISDNGENESAIEKINKVVSDAEKSIASTIEKVKAEFGDNSAASNITEQAAQAYADKAIATATQELQSKLDDNNSKIQNLQRTFTTKTESLASQISTLESRVDSGSSSEGVNTSALNEVIRNANAYTDKAISAAEENLESKYGDISQALSRTKTEAIASANAALAGYSQAASARFENLEASSGAHAQSLANIDGRLNSTYTIKVEQKQNGQKYAAGMVLGLGNQGKEPQSYVLFDADTFAISNGYGIDKPFEVKDGQVKIKDALIDKAEIKNATIETLKVTQDIIGTEQIQKGAVTKAQKNQYIVSIQQSELDFYGRTGPVVKRVVDLDIVPNKLTLFKISVTTPQGIFDRFGNRVSGEFKFIAKDQNGQTLFDFPLDSVDFQILPQSRISIDIEAQAWGDMNVTVLAAQWLDS